MRKFAHIYERFLHGGDTYYAGEYRSLDTNTFDLATKHGWAGTSKENPNQREEALPAVLEVQNGSLAVKSKE